MQFLIIQKNFENSEWKPKPALNFVKFGIWFHLPSRCSGQSPRLQIMAEKVSRKMRKQSYSTQGPRGRKKIMQKVTLLMR